MRTGTSTKGAPADPAFAGEGKGASGQGKAAADESKVSVGEGKAATTEGKALPAGPVAAAGTDRSATAKGSEPKPEVKVRRIEDLPPAAPLAYRPLRVEELPVAPSAGGRRAKEAAAGSIADPKRKPGAGQPLRVEDLPSVSAAVRPLRTDELNPELVKRADDLLWHHPAPVGVDVPLEVNGKNYIARFAYHYHEFGSAKKPWGYHKGVTLYSTAE